MTENSDDSFTSSKAEVFEALGHPTRIRILQELAKRNLSPISELKRTAGHGEQRPSHVPSGKDEGLVRLNPEATTV